MGQRTSRSFRPQCDGFRLESRVVLSAASAAPAPAAISADATNNATSPVTVKNQYIQATFNQLHSAYKDFMNKTTRACQNAVKQLGNGQTEANLLAGLKDYTALEGGVLETRLNQVSRRLPGGEPGLYAAPGGLKAQADALIANLTAPTTLQAACNQNALPTILTTYQNSRATTKLFIQSEVQSGTLTTT